MYACLFLSAIYAALSLSLSQYKYHVYALIAHFADNLPRRVLRLYLRSEKKGFTSVINTVECTHTDTHTGHTHTLTRTLPRTLVQLFLLNFV